MSTHGDHDDFGGMHRDLLQTGEAMDRRKVFRIAARFGVSMGALQLLGCGADAAALTTAGTSGSSGTSGAGTNGTCTVIPQETAGPYPGDSSNGPNVLNQTGVVRTTFGPASRDSRAPPPEFRSTSCSLSSRRRVARRSPTMPCISGTATTAATTRSTRAGTTNQNYLRGVQAADANGVVTFTTIYPGCYSGRWPHIHFEVYQSLAAATAVSNKIATSQIAMPLAANDLVYATSLYASSARNQSQITLASDMVFSDGAALELATVTGDVTSGMTAALTIAV